MCSHSGSFRCAGSDALHSHYFRVPPRLCPNGNESKRFAEEDSGGLLSSEHASDSLFFFLLLFFAQLRRRHLRVAPIVEDADLVYALNRASGRAPFLSFVFPLEVFHGVVFERNS